MTTSSVSNSANTTATANAGSSAAATAASVDPLANEQVFLQLLVAQLKYQDPESPADGTQFVTQLAQFADLEQVTQSRTDLDSIKQQLSSQGSAEQNSATSATSGSSSTSPSTTSSTNGIS